MSHEDRMGLPPRNGPGGAALVLGVLALVFAFVPIVGEFLTAPAALLAIILGLVGLVRVDRGTATNGGQALAGSILGLVAALVMLLMIAAATARP